MVKYHILGLLFCWGGGGGRQGAVLSGYLPEILFCRLRCLYLKSPKQTRPYPYPILISPPHTYVCKLEGDTGVSSQTSPVPLPQKCISSRPNPTKKLGGNPVPFHSWKNDSHSLPLPCCIFFFFAEICQLQ